MNTAAANISKSHEPVGGFPTAHGLQRTMEWMHMNRNQAVRCIENAWNRGMTMNDLQYAHQRQYLAARDGRFKEGPSEFRVYQEHLFVFSPDQGLLVTMYPTPRSFRHKPVYAGKERVRNVRQYCRMSPADDDYDLEDRYMMKGAC